jgi:hypothetical protein
MRMGRYYLPNDALMQFFQSLKLCVEVIGPMPRRIRAGPQCGGASTHSSVLHIGDIRIIHQSYVEKPYGKIKSP